MLSLLNMWVVRCDLDRTLPVVLGAGKRKGGRIQYLGKRASLGLSLCVVDPVVKGRLLTARAWIQSRLYILVVSTLSQWQDFLQRHISFQSSFYQVLHISSSPVICHIL
jgi:hypothetical protein